MDGKQISPGKRPGDTYPSTSCHSKKKCFTPSTMPKPDLKSLVSELKEVTDWHSLGIHLGIDPSKLEEIEENNRTIQRRKSEVLKTWLDIDEYSWEKVCDVLRNMDKKVIAERIEKKYLCTSSADIDKSLDIEADKKVCGQIIESVTRIAQDLGQDAMQTSTQIQGALERLNSGKVKIGVAGMTNAGKSTALNALLGGKFLPASFQRQTAVKLCIISTTTSKKRSSGQLFGKKAAQTSFVELASGHDKVHECLVKLNVQSQMQDMQYAELCLKVPIPFLQKKSDMSLEIYDTPGINEISSSSAAIGINALEEMAAIILILDGGAVGTKGQDELVQELRRFHPLMESHGRVLILINKYDALFDGNKESWTPEELKMEVSSHFPKVSSDTIIPFSPKYALQAREWKANAENVSDNEYGRVYYFLTGTLAPKKDSIEELRERCPKNVKELTNRLEEFSNIQRVESRLLNMLCEHDLILLQSAIDDTLRIISKLKSTIKQRHTLANVSAKEQEMLTQQIIVRRANEVIESECKPKFKKFPADVAAAFKVQRDAAASSLESHIKTEVSNGLVTLRVDFNNQHSAFQGIQSMRKEIISKAESELEKAWHDMDNAIQMHLRGKLDNELHMLEATFVSRQVFECVSLKGINTNTLINRISMPKPSLSVPDCSEINDNALNRLVDPHAITKQRLENRKKRDGRRYGLFGPRDVKHYVVAVDYQETVYRVRFDDIRNKFTIFASSCADHFNKSVDETVRTFAQELSKEISKTVDAKLSRSLRSLHSELQKKEQDLEQSRNMSESLTEMDRKLDEDVNKLHVLNFA